MERYRIYLLGVVLIAVLAWVSWLFRYEVVTPHTNPDGSANVVHILDRWTGDVLICSSNKDVPCRYLKKPWG